MTSASINAFLMIFGHRAPLDYELAEPRFSEDMNLVRMYIQGSPHAALDTPGKQDAESLSSGKRPALPDGRLLAVTVQQSKLTGKRVAGDHEVAGRVRVITDIELIRTVENGEILVARMTDPARYPLFSQARGIVTEVGGWLIHAAIIAREYDLPAVVGVTGVCQRLQTGDIIRMNLSGNVKILENRRTAASAMQKPAVVPGSVSGVVPSR